MTCYRCGTRVREDMAACPRCGAALTFVLRSSRRIYGPYTIAVLRRFVQSGQVPGEARARRADGAQCMVADLLEGAPVSVPIPARDLDSIGDAETIPMPDQPLPPPPGDELDADAVRAASA